MLEFERCYLLSLCQNIDNEANNDLKVLVIDRFAFVRRHIYFTDAHAYCALHDFAELNPVYGQLYITGNLKM